MEIFKAISDFWPVFLSIIGLIVWLVRLEGRVGECFRYIQAVDKKVEILQIKHESLDSKTVEQLGQVRESLARIEGALRIGRQV